MDLRAEDWWATLRLPLVAIIALTCYLIQRHKVQIPPTKPVDVEPKPASELQNETVLRPTAKSKAKKAPKKFTRTIPDQMPAPRADNLPMPPEIHIFYVSQFNHTSTLAKNLVTIVADDTSLHN